MTTLRNILPEQVLVDILTERFQVSELICTKHDYIVKTIYRE